LFTVRPDRVVRDKHTGKYHVIDLKTTGWSISEAFATANPGDHSLTATAGPVPGETDTADNSRSTVVTVESAITDIAITAVDAPSPVVQGDLFNVSVTVENVGNQDVSSDINVTLASNLDGDIGTKTISGILTAGSFTTVTFTWDTSGASAGSHILTASHDFSDDATSNNFNSTTVTVQAATTDIAITSVSAPGSAVQGNMIDVGVTVENTGNQDVSSISVTLTDETDGVPIDTQIITNGLAAGASTTVTFSWDTTNATVNIDHILTASHDFADSDAGNDSKSTVVHVQEKPATPTMHVGDITFEADVWSLGKWGTLSRVTVIVPILDSSDAGVDRAIVYGSWSGAYNRNVSGYTNSQGQVIFSTRLVRGSGTFAFTINDVAKAGWTYDSTANIETSDSISVP